MTIDDTDETTVVTRVGLPKAPPQFEGTYFEQIVKQMATFVEEVRGYRSDLVRKSDSDAINWDLMKKQVAGVRSDFSVLTVELAQFRSALREEVASAKRESDGKIKVLELKVEQLGDTVAALENKLADLERGQDPRDRVTLLPAPNGPSAAKTG